MYTEVKMWDYDKRKWGSGTNIIINCGTVPLNVGGQLVTME